MLPSVFMSASCLSSSSVIARSRRSSVVLDADEDDSATPVVREVVGKHTFYLSNRSGGVPSEALLPFRQVGLRIGQ